MQRAFYDNVILVPAPRFLEDDLVIANQLIRAHRRDHNRHRNGLQGASRRISRGAMIDAMPGIGSPRCVRA